MQYLLIGIGSLIITTICTFIELKILRKRHIGQYVRELGPEAHMKKMGTPTMGGISIIIVSTVIIALFATKYTELWLALIPFVGFGIVGFLDDRKKYTQKKNDGISPKQKMLLLFIVTAIFITLYIAVYDISTITHIPFINYDYTMSIPLTVIFLAFILLASSNAVNITDGLDGLASGVAVIAMMFFLIIASVENDIAMVIFSIVVIGAILGFLVFNIKPAKIFLGDTGSLAIGGAIAAIAILTYRPIYLAIVLFIPVLETLSVVLQVGYFKITHGKRLFKMAPLHHHFELSGFSEQSIVIAFWLVTLVCSIIAYFV